MATVESKSQTQDIWGDLEILAGSIFFIYFFKEDMSENKGTYGQPIVQAQASSGNGRNCLLKLQMTYFCHLIVATSLF